jgi:nitrous oxidase accessory protein NosD
MATRRRRAWRATLALLVSAGVSGAMVATTAPIATAASGSCSVTNTDTGAHYTSLQKAIAKAQPGRTLRISGTCVGHFSVGKALTLEKGAGGAILKGSGATVLTVSGPVTLIGLRITGGKASVCPSYPDWVCGGGIANTGTLTAVDSTITGNRAVGGATRSALGGGIYNAAGASLTLIGSTVSGNTASSAYDEADGAGIDNEGVLHLIRSTVSDNHATSTVNGYGGGIFDYLTTTLVITASTISGNSVDAPAIAQGGGVFIEDGAVTVTNSTLTGNRVSGGAGHGLGGGIYDSSTTLTVSASTIAGNHVADPTGKGGGIYSGGTPLVSSTIIAGNSADTGRDCTMENGGSSQGYNLIGSGASCLDFQNGVNHDRVGTNNAPVDPKLAPLANNGGPTRTRALKPGSPAINAGPHSMCDTAKDQRGVSRPQHGGCDMGAFEKN